MKKIFSALIALCMVLSMTAFAELTTDATLDITADKTEVVAGDVITFTIKTTGDSNGLAYLNGLVKFNYDPNQLTVKALTSSKMTSAVKFSKCNLLKSESEKTISLQLSASQASMEDGEKFDENIDTLKGEFELGSFTATVKEGATGSIKFELNDDTYLTYANEAGVNEDLYITYNGSVTTKALAHAIPTITVKSGSTDPVITEEYPTTGAAGQGLVDKSVDKDGNYDIVAKAPIGKKAVITVDGGVVPGHIYKGKPSTSVKVEFVDDDDYSVITYPIIYKGVIEGTTEGVVVFGKGTIDEGDEYGIKLTKGEKSTKYKAGFNAAGIFGVAFIDGEGEYTAQAYVNDATGRVVSFTK